MEDTLKILVVDDDEVDRMAVRRALAKANLQVRLSEARSFSEALTLLEDEVFDCAFLDYQLPEQDGLVLVQEVRKQGIRVPLVVLTGQGDEQIAVELMKAGATDYLAKSRVTPERLEQVLRSAIRVYRAEVQVVIANQQLRETNELLIRKNQELESQRQQIQLQNLKLLEASRLKSQFLATMSHELRTPLNAIIGFSQLLLRRSKGVLTTQQTDMIERILNNGKHLLELLNDILDLSKIESGRLELKPETFNVGQVVRATVEELRSLADEKHLSVQLTVASAELQIYNDPHRLRQVLVNLLSNAIKFTDRGSISIDVRTIESEWVAITVRDTGIGIAPEKVKQIFEPFRQIDQTTTRRHAGTGLGLAITDSLVRMMQGKITVESRLGEGSVFRVELPRQLPSAEQATTTKSFIFSGSDSLRSS
jgi:signal transduction histidine kinase